MMSRGIDVLAGRVAFLQGMLIKQSNSVVSGQQHLCAKCKPQELRSWLQTKGFPTEAGNIGERKEGRERNGEGMNEG